MKANSLAFRLVLSSAAWTLLILSITAAVLISLCRDLIEESFDQRLNQYLEYLIARSAPQSGAEIKRPDNLGEPLFSTPLSGSYWQIKPAGKNTEPIYKSDSLVGETFKTPSELDAKPDVRQVRQAYVEGPEGQILRVLERDIVFTQDNEPRVFSFSVAVDSIEIEGEVGDFTHSIVLTLGLLGAGLLAATFFQVRFGLSPLADLRQKLAAIRSGDETRLEGSMPAEIAPLQNELNALIEANRDVVERARTHVGNLAHALKTPLTVIINEANGQHSDFALKVNEQAGVMKQQISHHLDRARIAAQIRAVSGVTNVSSELDLLSRALMKIYESRSLTLSVDCPSSIRFAGEKQDFEEMAGNLMDNACKWARTAVRVKVEADAAQPANTEKTFQIIIEDDGPGLPADFRESAVQRGRRLDENIPGSGLGLSIVADLSHLYQGALKLEEGSGGGLLARLTLPSAN